MSFVMIYSMESKIARSSAGEMEAKRGIRHLSDKEREGLDGQRSGPV